MKYTAERERQVEMEEGIVLQGYPNSELLQTQETLDELSSELENEDTFVSFEYIPDDMLKVEGTPLDVMRFLVKMQMQLSNIRMERMWNEEEEALSDDLFAMTEELIREQPRVVLTPEFDELMTVYDDEYDRMDWDHIIFEILRLIPYEGDLSPYEEQAFHGRKHFASNWKDSLTTLLDRTQNWKHFRDLGLQFGLSEDEVKHALDDRKQAGLISGDDREFIAYLGNEE